jgi:hypothetical protein
MKYLPILFLLYACGGADGEPIRVEPVEVRVTVEGTSPIVLQVKTKEQQ